MMTLTTSHSREAVTKTRARWAREGGASRRYSAARVRFALRARLRNGWTPVVPEGGAAHERVTVLCPGHSLASLARAYLAGERWFDRLEIEAALGLHLNTRASAAALARAGFAMLCIDGPHLELKAADTRLAQLVNRARLGPQRRGYRVRRVLEAVLALPPRKKRRCPVTDDRRLEAARRLQELWLLDGDDLLNCRPFARLSSHWTF